MAFGIGKKDEGQEPENTPLPINTSGEMPFPPEQMSSQYPPPPGSSQKSSPASGMPVDQVINLRQQGMSNNQIVQALQRDGYNSGQIFDAMNQADLQGGSASPVSMGSGTAGPPPEMPPIGPGPDALQPQPSYFQPQNNSLPPTEGMPAPFSQEGGDLSRVEEIAEAIIDEKWEEIIKSVNKILEWKDTTETRMARIEQQFSDLKDNFENLHKAIVGKVGEYDKNILSVGTEIKAMEKVFQKILPTFTENVSELSRITRNIKKPSSRS